MVERRTVAICDECWKKQRGDQHPVRLKEDAREVEWCAWCGQLTESGIYVRGVRHAG